MVEFALISGILFLFIAGIFDFGRAIFILEELGTAANEGARQAILSYDQLSNNTSNGCVNPNLTTCQTYGVMPTIKKYAGYAVTLNYQDSTSTCAPPATATYTPPTSGSPYQPGTISLVDPTPNQAYVYIYEIGPSFNSQSAHPDNCAPAATNYTYWPCENGDSSGCSNVDVVRQGGFNYAVVDIKYAWKPFFGILLPFLPNNGIVVLDATSTYQMEY